MKQQQVMILGAVAIGAFLLWRQRSAAASAGAPAFNAPFATGSASGQGAGNFGLPSMMFDTRPTLDSTKPLATTGGNMPLATTGGNMYQQPANDGTRTMLPDGSLQLSYHGQVLKTISPGGYITYPDGSGGYITGATPDILDRILPEWGITPDRSRYPAATTGGNMYRPPPRDSGTPIFGSFGGGA